MANRLTIYIVIALILGLFTGWAMHEAIKASAPATAAVLKDATQVFPILTTIFLRLIKMIIAPLVFSTLIVGIAHMGDSSALGRVGLRALTWFIGASLVSLTLGLILVHLLQPGAGLALALPPVSEASGVDKAAFNLKDFVTHIVPASIVEALAKNEIIQIVVFSVFAGVAITSLGERAAPLVRGAEALAEVMLKVTNYVMALAPVAVFAAVANSLAERGPEVIGNLGYFMASFYLALMLLWTVLIAIGGLFLGRDVVPLVRAIRAPLLLAFSTASSEAAYPKTLEALEKYGVPPRIASFMLPLGYSFNLDGSMMYMTFASLFIAQAYGIQLTLSAQITMLLVLMVTSKGIAGVPRASLVVVAATLPLFGIPEAGLLLILAVDQFLDMGRSATNVVGNAVATAVIARWESGRPARAEAVG
ncbi:MAG: dicarboxylate/amino acid:cation symporter [Sphingomonas sp.]|uniref:dicarboxylate/amino acid:cation symporter n=1 Tax=Sphingomonas sp. TaxID=28214 RepID=UPI0025EF3C92|nr:dicarboxylate/amino acid:cation symporter [Sphingomonas sp.]MBX9880858.1 dicarboxylate/amino acid:cation symporter [Sphingomonas sp.]